MKNIIALLLSVILFYGCNTAGDKHEIEITETKSKKEVEAPLPDLNNGAKWRSDESTKLNVRALQTMARTFNDQREPSVLSYTTLGNDYRKGLDIMISGCKMKGADHDALHVWLMPLMKDVKALQKTKNEEDAAALNTSITNRLNAYHNLFE